MTSTIMQSSSEETAELTASAQPLIISDEKIADRWSRVMAFQIDDPTAKTPFSYVLSERMFWTSEMTEFIVLEYKKFMLLCSLYPQGNITPSVDIDTVWHLHLLYTNCYFRFCNEALDCVYLHHEPSKGNEEEVEFHEDSYDDTLEKYEQVFGSTPPKAIWGSRVRNM